MFVEFEIDAQLGVVRHLAIGAAGHSKCSLCTRTSLLLSELDERQMKSCLIRRDTDMPLLRCRHPYDSEVGSR